MTKLAREHPSMHVRHVLVASAVNPFNVARLASPSLVGVHYNRTYKVCRLSSFPRLAGMVPVNLFEDSTLAEHGE